MFTAINSEDEEDHNNVSKNAKVIISYQHN
jgi:hypothetical protein